MMSPTADSSPTVILNGTASSSTVSTASDGAQPRFVVTSTPSNSSTGSSGEQKSQCSSLSDGENFEWNTGGEDSNSTVEVVLEREGQCQSSTGPNEASRSPSGINRNSWLRTSLRKSTSNNPDSLSNRRWGSFRHNGRRTQNLGPSALASQLYRSSSFNSSGRSSTCDTTDDMYSDASLEEDVHDLHHKFTVLQQQVGVLQDSAQQTDERYTRIKADNAALQARVIMLEEQLRDTELRCEEKLQDEQRRSKELVHRIEREKQLQLENASIRLQNAQSECEKLRDEVGRQRTKLEKLEKQKDDLSSQLRDANYELSEAREEVKECRDRENRLIKDHENHIQLLEDLSKEIDRLKAETRTPALPTTSPDTLRLEELHEEMSALRAANGQLREANDELQASLLHAGLETGQRMLTNGETSLARELDIMSHDEALKEQQEVNRQLRTYIEGILLNIVENHPQLLEVKQKKNGLKN
ncbi:rab11 family-interacting protein 4B isoform X2 [Sitophilus oryzae]|uniref:Rab11 family-interacting protein 4B isoform X2 n=1 Tax=Sitophilus oryzae TaxID=7048 RepID=A0A6J2YTC3_SITOR|nr:rab11 family-interacting protein 4B isoform X2 [Sitophilus oryzae]